MHGNQDTVDLGGNGELEEWYFHNKRLMCHFQDNVMQGHVMCSMDWDARLATLYKLQEALCIISANELTQ